MLSVGFLINSRLLLKFWGRQIYTQIFDCLGTSAPTPMLFKNHLKLSTSKGFCKDLNGIRECLMYYKYLINISYFYFLQQCVIQWVAVTSQEYQIRRSVKKNLKNLPHPSIFWWTYPPYQELRSTQRRAQATRENNRRQERCCHECLEANNHFQSTYCSFILVK